jgi:hypothetical protein
MSSPDVPPLEARTARASPDRIPLPALGGKPPTRPNRIHAAGRSLVGIVRRMSFRGGEHRATD